MEVYHASVHSFDEFGSSPEHKELGHHFSPHRDLCLTLIDTSENHHVYQSEIPEGPYWEMFDIANWENTEEFIESFQRSLELNNKEKDYHSLVEATASVSPQEKQAILVKVLQKKGYVGISYHNEHERGRQGSESYLVFSEDDIELLEREDIPGLDTDDDMLGI